MTTIMYMNNKEEVDRLKGSEPRVNYCSGLLEIANKINKDKRWICFDSKEDVGGYRFYYYQDKISHCNVRIGMKHMTLLAKFSFAGEGVLEETLHELGLPEDESP